MFGSASWSYYLNIFCSSHLEVGIEKHLNQPFILIYKISITRSRHPDVKCRKRQTRSEMWIHRNLSGKDRSSSHSIKTLFPLSGPSDHVHKKKVNSMKFATTWCLFSPVCYPKIDLSWLKRGHILLPRQRNYLNAGKVVLSIGFQIWSIKNLCIWCF